MKNNCSIATLFAACAGACLKATAADPPAQASSSEGAAVPKAVAEAVAPNTADHGGDGADQKWNWHVQNTDIVQLQPSFPAAYSGPNSLLNATEARESISVDLMIGARLWRGAEFHLDGLMWQGYGLSKTLGAEGFPNAEAYRYGVTIPNVNLARIFIRQTIGLGGEQEVVEDDQFHLAGKQDVSRITLTAGKMSVHDIFDNNAYAADPRRQFLNWGTTANLAWDYSADSLGYISGFAAELNQPQWTLRYGFFQMPRVSNGLAVDQSVTRAWGMVTEFERRYAIHNHPGAVRFLVYLNRAHMGSYQEALDNSAVPNIVATRDYRYKYGFGLNFEQELTKGIGAFGRFGWGDGRTEAWAYSDVDETASLGLSFSGSLWKRANDTVGAAGIINAISKVHQEFLAAGGTGILAGDGALDYGWEKVMEIYYDFGICKSLHGALDYQFIENPAFNRARGPVSIFGARMHLEF